MRNNTTFSTARPARLIRRQRTRALLREITQTTSPAAREAAIDEVIRLNMDLARTLAAPYRGRGIPTEDLEQVAYTALVRAVRGYRHGLSGDFLAYAVPTIRGEVKKHFRDHGWAVRPPRRIQELQAAATRARADLERDTGIRPDLSTLAAAMGEPEEQVAEALAAEGCFTPSSLDQPLRAGSSLAIGDTIADTDDGYEAAEARAILAPAVRRLGRRDRRILQLRFFDGLTQQEIGEEIGVTQMQVSRLLNRIMRDLRTDLVDDRMAMS
jgi:RNA polymerase sigma-B factor